MSKVYKEHTQLIAKQNKHLSSQTKQNKTNQVKNALKIGKGSK
jgi:hypothetical protein